MEWVFIFLCQKKILLALLCIYRNSDAKEGCPSRQNADLLDLTFFIIVFLIEQYAALEPYAALKTRRNRNWLVDFQPDSASLLVREVVTKFGIPTSLHSG